jgi:hypothetical protein
MRPRVLSITLVLALVAVSPGASTAHALAPLAAEATRLVRIGHRTFLAEKVLAPAPFDWSSDGCTGTPPSWAEVFDQPCQQHDFGYRNLGRGLALRPSERVRAWVDRRLLEELRSVCAQLTRGLGRTRCRARARAMYAAVRIFNPDWGG